MHAFRFRIRGLLIIAALINFLVGLSIHLLPQQNRWPTVDTLGPNEGYLSTALMAGGVLSLIAARYPLRPWLQRLASALGAAPFAAVALLLAQAGLQSLPIPYLVMALALVIAPWLPTGDDGRWRLSYLVLAAMEIIVGLRLIIAPARYYDQLFLPDDPLGWLVGPLAVIGGVALLTVKPGDRSTRARLRLILPILFPVVAAANAWDLCIGPAVAFWGVWAAALGGTIWREAGRLIRLEPVERSSSLEEAPIQTERLLELWSWGLMLMILIVSLFGEPGAIASPLIINLFVALVSGYNTLIHSAIPHIGRPDRRVLLHVAAMTVAVGLLLVDGGRWSFVLSALIMVPPILAASVHGARIGYIMLGFSMAVVLLFQLPTWHRHNLDFALTEIGVQLMVMAAAGMLGIRSAAEQAQLVGQLASARSDLQRQVQQQALVFRIGAAIRSSLDLDEILTTTVREMGVAVGVSRCFIRLRGAHGFLPVLHQYVAPDIFPLNEDHLPHHKLSRVVSESGQVVVIDDLAQDEAWRETWPAGVTRAALAAPIQGEKGLLGVIIFHQCHEPRQWKQDEIQFIEAVAGQVAIAMVHAQAHSDLELRHQELTRAHSDLQAQDQELAEALRAAQTAEEIQARLIAILEATTDFVGLTDRAGNIIYLNQVARLELGLGDEPEIQLNSEQIFTPAFVASGMLRRAMMTALRRGTWSGEGALLGAGGREIPVSLVILGHKDRAGEIFFATIARDISAQKLAQEALSDSEERFRTAFGFAPIGMGMMDIMGHWIQVNPLLCEMLGYTEAELTSMRFRQLVHHEDWPKALEQIARIRSGKIHTVQMEQRWLHKLGHVVWTQVSASRVSLSDAETFHYVLHVQDITERKQVEHQLIRLANYDPLTNLFNRRRFQEELERHLAHSARYGTHGALLFLDLDQFKYINDSLGHQAGDQLLRSLGDLLRAQLREGDAIARLGGDEFAMLLPQASAAEAETVAQRLLDALRRHVEVIAGRAVGITGSLGIALFPEHGKTVEDLLAYADMAMYRVKDFGRNNFSLYNPDEATRHQLESKLTWERRIHEALAQDRFVLYQQPILHLASGQIHRYEALLRMHGPDGEVYAPGSFLPIAERFGLIYAIDRWVVREAIRLIALRQQSDPDFCLEVNLSGKALADPELLPLIQREIECSGINPAGLILEITETAACTDQAAALEFVTTLRQLGCRFALDDFGSGFSSFSYLKHLPVDYLKIDGSFIRHLARDPVDQELVRGIIQVARALAHETIAECVEDAATLALVQEFGADYAQGYHIGRPEPIEPGHTERA